MSSMLEKVKMALIGHKPHLLPGELFASILSRFERLRLDTTENTVLMHYKVDAGKPMGREACVCGFAATGFVAV